MPEYQWLLQNNPNLAVAYYFIATAHDFLGEYAEALTAYETFIARADPRQNQLEIDKAKMRLPAVRNEMRRGHGSKHKTQ
jgi:tetratricopeptide (TPR) repeat protein